MEFEGCIVEFSFSTEINRPIEIENSEFYGCPTSTIPWIIAGSLVGAILLLGLLALIILKICLVFLVSRAICRDLIYIAGNGTVAFLWL